MSLPIWSRYFAEEVLGQQRNVFVALAQRRQVNRDDVDAVEQVLAELALRDHLGQILIGGGDDAHRRLELFDAAQPAELPLLQHAQQLHLHHRRHLADFVEEQRALLGRFDQPLLVGARAGERAFHVAEELRFEQRLRQRAAVERHERTIAPQRIEMDGARDPFLAGARLAGDEHGAVGARDLLDQLEDGEHLVAAADDVRELVRACRARASAARSPGGAAAARARCAPSSSARRRRTAC